MQSRPGIDHDLSIDGPVLEPRPTGPRPRRSLQKRIRVLAELIGSGLAGAKGFDILNLHFEDYFVHVGVPLFDQREERAVGERSVGPAEREVIWEFRYPYAEIGRHVTWGPYVAKVSPLANEGEAGGPSVR